MSADSHNNRTLPDDELIRGHGGAEEPSEGVHRPLDLLRSGSAGKLAHPIEGDRDRSGQVPIERSKGAAIKGDVPGPAGDEPYSVKPALNEHLAIDLHITVAECDSIVLHDCTFADRLDEQRLVGSAPESIQTATGAGE